MKVLTVSRTFPKGHFREGELTFFVEKICRSVDLIRGDVVHLIESFMYANCYPKYHTIRAGQRWKIGDDISLRFWSGPPYRSKQVEFLKLKVVNIWNIQIFQNETEWDFFINGTKRGSTAWKHNYHENIIDTLASNDGLRTSELLSWFKPKKIPFQFAGQIITWSKDINYDLNYGVEKEMTSSHCI
jgi:hypothetical protein